jgi:hypothetical protein
MTLAEAIEAAREKTEEAGFFHGKLREIANETHHNLAESERHFGWFLSAFLSASRAAALIIKEVVGQAALTALKVDWTPNELALYDALTEMRNANTHRTGSNADSTIEYVPESELPRSPRHPFDGYVIIRRPPGVAETRVGVKRFAIQIGGESRPAVDCCARYLELNIRITSHFATLLNG